ncbi:MAG: PAS domain S-box-containing protein [Akkermansiaceae bacterium]|jgi:PAS domain S-box-containing protein
MDPEIFLDGIGGNEAFKLFDHLPGYSFFAKDFEGTIMSANRPFYERFGFRSKEEIVGKSDFDLFPAGLADKFRRDDLAVMDKGEAMLGIVELFLNRQGIPDWHLTNKLPVADRDGRMIGVMGTVRNYATQAKMIQPFVQIEAAVDFIRDHFRGPISVRDLAIRVGLSPRQFDRKFKEAFEISPQQFIIKTRILAGCEALADLDRPIADVAFELGFCDQSSFTMHFRKQMGITPLQYRKRL